MTLPRICAARIKSGSADRNATPVVSPVLTAGKRFVPILWGGWHLYPSQQAKRSVGPCSPLRRGANCTSVYKEKLWQKLVDFLITLAAAHSYSRQPVVWCVATGGENNAKHFGRSLLRQHHTRHAGHGAQLRVETGDGSCDPFRKAAHRAARRGWTGGLGKADRITTGNRQHHSTGKLHPGLPAGRSDHGRVHG